MSKNRHAKQLKRKRRLQEKERKNPLLEQTRGKSHPPMELFSPAFFQKIGQAQAETVGAIFKEGKTSNKAIEAIMNCYGFCDALASKFDEQVTPACKDGCSYCCHGSVVCSNAELLLACEGYRENKSPKEMKAMLERAKRNSDLMEGKSKREVLTLRAQLPCPFLEDERCSIYPIRPLTCRGYCSSNSEECAQVYRSLDPDAEHLSYPQREMMATLIQGGLLAGCHDHKLESVLLDLSKGLHIIGGMARGEAIDRWLEGETLFAAAGGRPFTSNPRFEDYDKEEIAFLERAFKL